MVGRGGADVSVVERRQLRLAFIASYVLLLAAFNEGASTDPDAIEAALRLNPYDSNAQLRLMRAHLDRAERLYAAGQTAEALPHYRAFLEMIAQHRERRPNPETLVPAILKFGDALAKSGYAAEARKQYELAESIAAETGLSDLRKQARTRLARP